MIHIQTKRWGIFVVAATVNSNLDVEFGFGFTVAQAENNLLKKVGRK